MIRVLIALLLCSALLPAQTIIRLGTMVPKGSPWHAILLNMGEEWKKASGGKVELRIYPTGEQGDEPLLGATSLESIGLVLDPFKRRLIPMRMLLV